MPSLHFKGKSAVWNHHHTVPYHELIPRKQKSMAKKRLVFAPVKYLDEDMLLDYGVAFAQLPFEIYRLSS